MLEETTLESLCEYSFVRLSHSFDFGIPPLPQKDVFACDSGRVWTLCLAVTGETTGNYVLPVGQFLGPNNAVM
jgi:hypothetical protein